MHMDTITSKGVKNRPSNSPHNFYGKVELITAICLAKLDAYKFIRIW